MVLKGKIKAFKNIFYSMIAEMDMVVYNLLNLFFITRFVGSDGAAAYEIIMPCLMVVSAVVALGFNGIQAICAKDYGAKDFESFDRHKNAGYAWILLILSILSVIFIVFKAPILDLLGANEGNDNLKLLSEGGYIIFMLCALPLGLFSIASGLLYFEEKKQLLIINVILYVCFIGGNILVTIINPTMINYLIINLISFFVVDLYIIGYFIIRKNKSKAAISGFNLKFKDFRNTFFTGLPDFMEYAFVGILYLVENLYVLSRFNQSVVSGISVFEAIDNFPETICVGFSFLVTAHLGTKVGRLVSDENDEAKTDLDKTAKTITRGAIIGGIIVAIILVILSRPMVYLFLKDTDIIATNSAVLLTISCAIGFIFYLINTEIVCYYKIVGAYIPAHILFFVEALGFPLIFKLVLGEMFGLTGFCLGGGIGEIAVFIFNIFIIWILSKRFPKRISDFRLEKYINHLKNKKSEL